MHCVSDKSNNRTRGQSECDVTYFFLFLFDFVNSHARCGCTSIVYLRFQVMQNDTKNNFFFKKNIF